MSDYLQKTFDEWRLILFWILASASCHCLLLYLVGVLRCQQHSQQQYSNRIVVIIIITKSLHVSVSGVRVQKNKRDGRCCSCEPCAATRCTGSADASHVAYCGSGHVLINIITQPGRLRKHGNLRQTAAARTPRLMSWKIRPKQGCIFFCLFFKEPNSFWCLGLLGLNSAWEVAATRMTAKDLLLCVLFS